ncbi:MAG: hypothetical protein HZB91_01935 [Elusimicrobia bacterium]|nr:hypothetical protein [Elusimicrobiota bacterium]
MRYWIFQNNQVLGPHDSDELSALPHFSTDSLVCPEGRKGTSMGDWQRAGLVPELSLSLVKASQLSMASRPGDSSRVIAGLPPEPTLKDLAALGSLQEKVSFLENTLSLLQGELRMKDTELSTLHTQLEDRGVQALDLGKKIESLESKLGEMGNSLKEDLRKAADEERGVASDVETQRKTIEGLSSDLHKLQDELREIEKPVGEISKLKEELHNFEKPVGEIEKLKEELHSFEKKVEDAAAAAAAAPAPAPMPAPAPSPLPNPEPFSVGRPEPKPADAPSFQPMPEFTPAPAALPSPGSASPQFSSGMPDAGTAFPSAQGDAAARFAPVDAAGRFTPAPAEAAAAPASPVVEDAPPKPKRSKLLIFAVAGIVLAGVAAFFLGLIPLGKKPAPPPPPPPIVEAPPPPPPPPPEPPPEVVEAQRKSQALEIVRAWPLPNGKTVGAELEPAPAKGSALGIESLAFEVSLETRSIKAANKPAENLLAGKPVVEPPKPKKKQSKRKKDEAADALFEEAAAADKPADLSQVDELFGAPPEASPAPAPKARSPRTSRRKAAIEPKDQDETAEPSLDDLLTPEPKKVKPLPAEPSGEEAPVKTPKKKAAPEPEADDAKLLDDLLGQ